MKLMKFTQQNQQSFCCSYFKFAFGEKKILSMMSKEAKKSMVWSCVDKKSVLLRKSYGGVKILPGVC